MLSGGKPRKRRTAAPIIEAERAESAEVTAGCAILRELVPAPIAPKTLALVMELDVRNVSHWLHGTTPEPHHCWLMGEAFRQLGVAWASGLLFLYWYDKLSDFVGVVGMCGWGLVTFEDRFMALLWSKSVSKHQSPYDVLRNAWPDDRPMFCGKADQHALRVLADNGVVAVRPDIDFFEEADRLNARAHFRQTWQEPADFHDLIAAGACRWFGIPDDDKNGVPEYSATSHDDAERVPQDGSSLVGALAIAYELSNATALRRGLREKLVDDQLTQWFYTLAVGPPPSGILDWLPLALDPKSATARSLRLALRSYARLAEQANDVRLDDELLDMRDFMASYIERLIAKNVYTPEVLNALKKAAALMADDEKSKESEDDLDAWLKGFPKG